MVTVRDICRRRSVDVDPGWYVGQPETADVNALPAAAADEPASHVPSVLQKLLKWGNYDGYGEPVWPSRFVPMKTPLSEEILNSWELPEPPKHRLTVPDLLAAQTAVGRHVGLLLDLSNHDCLYAGDIPSDVQYLHVQLVAKELPPLEFVHEVGRAANDFWQYHQDDYIAIHCAYGFNRTGFVVCSYLIEHCGLSVEQALASFAKSRPPGVKHERFRDELHARYGSINQQLPRPITCIHAAAVYAQCNCSSASIAGCIEQGALLPPFLQPHLLSAADAARAEAQDSSGRPCSGSVQVQGEVSNSCECSCCGCSTWTDCRQQSAAAAHANSSSSCCCKQLPPLSSNPGAHVNTTSEGCRQLTGKAMRRSGSSSSSTRCNVDASVLSSSPLPRLPSRCQSSCSVGDNSSIGCSPPDLGAEMMLNGGSYYSPASSSALGSVHGYRVPIGLMGCSPVQRQQQQQQRIAGSSPLQHSSGVCAAAAPQGCSSDLDGTSDSERAVRLEEADTDCFEMDPCGEQPNGGGVSSSWHDSTYCCQQQQHAAELTGLMGAVNLEQQQQRQQQRSAELLPCDSSLQGKQQQQQQQQHMSPGIGACPCSCHSSEAHAPSSSGGAESVDQQGRQRSRLRYSKLNNDGSGFGGSSGLGMVENESFGKITSADLLKNLRGLQSNYSENG